MTTYQKYYLSLLCRERLPVKVNDIRYSKSVKSRECVSCGCEIPKGDYYYSYKPFGSHRKSRCLDHPPKIYNDYEKFDY